MTFYLSTFFSGAKEASLGHELGKLEMPESNIPGCSPQSMTDGNSVRKQPLVDGGELPHPSGWDNSEVCSPLSPRVLQKT